MCSARCWGDRSLGLCTQSALTSHHFLCESTGLCRHGGQHICGSPTPQSLRDNFLSTFCVGVVGGRALCGFLGYSPAPVLPLPRKPCWPWSQG